MKTYWKKDEGVQVKNINWRDIANLDDTFLQVIYESLRYFRKHCVGYPGYQDSMKHWKKTIKNVEDKFKKVIEVKYDNKEEKKANLYLHEALASLENIFFCLWV